MKFQACTEVALGHACPLLILFCYEGTAAAPVPAFSDSLVGFDQVLDGAISSLYRHKEFSGARNTTRLFHTLGRLPAERLLLVGMGKIQESDPEQYRQAAGSAAQILKSLSLTTCSLLLPAGESFLRAVAEGFVLGGYSFDQYRSAPEEKNVLVQAVMLVPGGTDLPAAETVLAEVAQIAAAVRFSRDLVSQPGNVATPAYLADLKNAGGPGAGTITAAWFLKQFVGSCPWAHLDIAGTTWEEKGRHYLPKGATGTGVRLLVAYVRGLC